jgi:hypothetical protein
VPPRGQNFAFRRAQEDLQTKILFFQLLHFRCGINFEVVLTFCLRVVLYNHEEEGLVARTWMDQDETLREWKVRMAKRRTQAPIAMPSADASEMLKPGVYVLSLRGKVVHVGRAKCMLTAIADHRTIPRGADKLPSWFPIKHVAFDSIAIHPMPFESTLALAQALTEFHLPTSQNSTPPGPFPPATSPPIITRRI